VSSFLKHFSSGFEHSESFDWKSPRRRADLSFWFAEVRQEYSHYIHYFLILCMKIIVSSIIEEN
jgi:hypothetical protein